jgi:hypothetical protein
MPRRDTPASASERARLPPAVATTEARIADALIADVLGEALGRWSEVVA